MPDVAAFYEANFW